MRLVCWEQDASWQGAATMACSAPLRKRWVSPYHPRAHQQHTPQSLWSLQHPGPPLGHPLEAQPASPDRHEALQGSSSDLPQGYLVALSHHLSQQQKPLDFGVYYFI